jgi:hypothetical protein
MRVFCLGKTGTRLISGMALGLVLAVAAPLRAQTEEERAGARAVATEGAQAFNEGRWADAVDLFTRAESLVHAPPHLLYLARAHEKLGHLVKARELFQKIVRETLAPGAPEAFRSAQTEAATEAQQIEARLPYLTIRLEGNDGKEVAVTMDGARVPPALLGVPRPVDPGEHKLEGVGQGLRAEMQTIQLAEAARESVTLKFVADPAATLPGAAAAPAATTAPELLPSASPGPAPSGTPTDAGAERRGDSLRVPAYIALGVGALGLGAGTFFVLRSSSKRSDADELYEERCQPSCLVGDPAAEEVAALDDDARSAQTLGIISYVVGGVGVAAGVTLLVLGGSESQAANDGLKIRPYLGVARAGLTGSF